MNRRDFIKKGLLFGAGLQLPHIWIKNLKAKENLFNLTLLQTNDTHSRIDPFPVGSGRYRGMGGIARRATLVKKIRSENPHTLLVDAGDVLQGTPYYNLFKGKVEYLTMSKCGYDVSTLGNHEFDNGVESLTRALSYANFDIVNCNFDFGNTPLESRIRTFVIKQVGPVKVGITGVGIDFTDMVAPQNHIGISYKEPYKPLQAVVNYLRKDLGCNLIIVLSHLGYKYKEKRPDDLKLAEKVRGIDWIVGGHSHTFMEKPEEIVSEDGHITRILQVGFGGILLGKTDFIFENKNLLAVRSQNISIDSNVPEMMSIEEMLA